MKKSALALAVVAVSICFGLPVQKANTSNRAGAEQMSMKISAERARTVNDRGSVPADVNDSDEFFRNAVKSGPERDNSQKI